MNGFIDTGRTRIVVYADTLREQLLRAGLASGNAIKLDIFTRLGKVLSITDYVVDNARYLLVEMQEATR